MSALLFKIKAKCKHTGTPHYQTMNLSTSHQAGYQSVLAESFDKSDWSSSINAQWDSSTSSIQKACKSLPPASRSSDPASITNEVHNLSRKKKEAWIRLKNAPPQDSACLKTEYDHLKKLTKVAAEKARNAWWSERAAEADCRLSSLNSKADEAL